MPQFTNKQAAFIREYLIDLNATQAAIRAGYSSRTARHAASRLLADVNIQNAIAAAMRQRSAQVNYTARNVLERHVQIDNLDVLDILNESGGLKPLMEWPVAWRKSISGFEVVELGTSAVLKKIKLPDKLRNLELLGRHVDVGAYGEQKGGDSDLASMLGQLIGGMPD